MKEPPEIIPAPTAQKASPKAIPPDWMNISSYTSNYQKVTNKV